MKFIISENKVESLKQIAQYLIDNELNNLRIMSDEEWGMGEMDEISEVASVDKIIVDKLEMSDGVNVYINMYVSTDREEFDLVLGAVEYSLEQWLPNIKVHVNEIITEQEKRNIRELYGLIVENDSDELLNYANNYIDTHSCDTIYQNLLSFQNAVNSGNLNMSDKNKQDLSNNLKKMKSYKNLFCNKIKEKMKETFQEEGRNNPEILKTYMCWFSANITKTNLNPCKSKPEPVQSTQEPVQTKVNTIPTNTKTTKSNDSPIRQDDLNPNVDNNNINYQDDYTTYDDN